MDSWGSFAYPCCCYGSKLFQMLASKRSLADQLPAGLGTIAQSPLTAFVALLVAYALFFLIFGPLYLLGKLITPFGVVIFLSLGIWKIIVGVARYLSFPGHTRAVQRDVEKQYAKMVVARLHQFGEEAETFCELLTRAREQAEGAAPAGGGLATLFFNQRFRLEHHLRPVAGALGALIEEEEGGGGGGGGVAGAELSPGRRALGAAAARALAAARPALAAVLAALAPHFDPPPSSSSAAAAAAAAARPLLEVLSTPGLGDEIEALDKAAKALRSTARKLKVPPAPADENPLMGALRGHRAAGRPFDHPCNIEAMRREVLACWGAERLAVPLGPHGSHGAREGLTLDGVYIRAAGIPPAGELARGAPAAAAAAPVSPLGAVLFCNPNAGLYESVCCPTLAGADWVAFYTGLGFDVACVNYRGYGRSARPPPPAPGGGGGGGGGWARRLWPWDPSSPHPAALCADGREVVRHLRRRTGARRVLVHGESMGGMVASHMAPLAGSGEDPEVAAVVADRTFGRLDAAAARLLAPWAGRAVRFFTRWEHDSTLAFRRLRCPKLICQDDDDKIIANAASLKSTLAIHAELGTGIYEVKELGQGYKIAHALGVLPPVPPAASVPRADRGDRLTEARLAHLFAVLARARRLAAGPAVAGGGEEGCPCGDCHEDAETAGARHPRCGSCSGRGSGEGSSPDDLFVHDVMEEIEMIEQVATRGPAAEGARTGGDAVAAAAAKAAFPSSAAALESAAWKQVWEGCRGADGAAGTPLGAAARSYDLFRAWACSLVTWGGRLLAPHPAAAAEPGGGGAAAATLGAAVRAVRAAGEEHAAVLAGDPGFTYLLGCLRYLEARCGGGGGGRGGGAAAAARRRRRRTEAGGRTQRAGSQYFDAEAAALGGFAEALQTPAAPSPAGAMDEEEEEEEEQDGDVADSSRLLYPEDEALGELLPLSCGHNAKFTKAEKESLRGFLKKHGLLEPCLQLQHGGPVEAIV